MRKRGNESDPRTGANSALENVSRRETLARTATATALGVVGTAGMTGSAAADHGCKWEEDTSAQESVVTGGGELTLTTDTDLCWHSWDSTERRHYFQMVTCSQTEYPDDKAIEAIREHRITVDGCQDELVPDISENETGTVPPDGTNEVDTDFGDIAGVAIEVVAGAVVFDTVVTVLDGVAETADILSGDSDCSGYTSDWSVDRVWDSDLKREKGVTTQCEFAVELPSGTSSGRFFLDSYTYCDDGKYTTEAGWCEIENHFQVDVYDNGDADLAWWGSTMDSNQFA